MGEQDIYSRRIANLVLPNNEYETLLSSIIIHGEPVSFMARGNSMFPVILDCDIVTISPITSQLEVGDVVAVKKHDTGFVIHRIIGFSSGTIIVKGDNIDEPDGAFPEINVIGIVSCVLRKSTKVSWGLENDKRFFAYISDHGYITYLSRLFVLLKKFGRQRRKKYGRSKS